MSWRTVDPFLLVPQSRNYSRTGVIVRTLVYYEKAQQKIKIYFNKSCALSSLLTSFNRNQSSEEKAWSIVGNKFNQLGNLSIWLSCNVRKKCCVTSDKTRLRLVRVRLNDSAAIYCAHEFVLMEISRVLPTISG